MITITGFLQRPTIYGLIRRWMFDQPQPADAGDLLRLVHFNNVFVSRYLTLLSEGVLAELHSCSLSSHRILTKGELKDKVATQLPYRTPRLDALIVAYGDNPGLYFRETPFQGTLYSCTRNGHEVYVGSSRIKRVRRLAEKSARRLVDWIYSEIQRRARQLTGEGGANVPPVRRDPPGSEGLATEELRHAETLFLDQLRAKLPSRLPEDLQINDVAGIKLIVEDHERGKLEAILQEQGCRVVEWEPHAGNYKATNVIVDYRPDKDRILARPLPQKITGVFDAHGIAEEEANQAFRDFVGGGEASVRVEIIVSDYAEMLESEIGRCMHEERIIQQRQSQEYQGQLARNIEFLLEYLFLLPAAPAGPLECLPIRLWDRYLPDYFDEVKRKMFDMPSVEFNEL